MQGYRGPEAALALLAKRAQRDLRWSRVFLYVGAVICLLPGLVLFIDSLASLGQVGSGSLALMSIFFIVVGGAAGAYFYWGFYWGWVAVWRWVRRLMGGNAPGSGLNWLAFTIFVILFLWLLSTIASWYGILGGGIYQYRKAKQIVAVATAHAVGTPGYGGAVSGQLPAPQAAYGYPGAPSGQLNPQRSPDGNYWWDGQTWRPVSELTNPGYPTSPGTLPPSNGPYNPNSGPYMMQ